MKKLICSFGFAFKGIAHAAATQLNFRIHLAASVIAVLLGFLLRISAGEWLWIILCITLVTSAELFNSAIETLTDLVSPAYNEQAGRTKDMGAGAVVITAIFALITGIIIFLPKLLSLF